MNPTQIPKDQASEFYSKYNTDINTQLNNPPQIFKLSEKYYYKQTTLRDTTEISLLKKINNTFLLAVDENKRPFTYYSTNTAELMNAIKLLVNMVNPNKNVKNVKEKLINL